MKQSKAFFSTVIVGLFLIVTIPQMAHAQGAGKALEFDGEDDYVDVGTLGSFGSELNSNYPSFSMWIKSSETDSLQAVLGTTNDKYDTGGNLYHTHLSIDLNSDYSYNVHAGYIFVKIRDEDNTAVEGSVNTNTGITDGNWHHLAVTIDNANNTIKVYVDNVLQTFTYYKQETPDNFANFQHELYLGAGNNRGSLSSCFTGILDDFRIWNVVLPADTIQKYMCRKVTSSHGYWSNLVGYWRLDEGSGYTTADGSTNSNTGTLGTAAGGDDGEPSWVWSGAAIGDVNAYDYSSSDGYTVNLASSEGDDITATTTSGTVSGIQVYRVDAAPNVTTPPSGWSTLSQEHYFGVFTVGSSVQYTVTYNYDGHPGINDETGLQLAYRSDNSASSWADLEAVLDEEANTLTKTDQTGTEYILGTTTSDNSLPVTLASFTATAGNGQITLEWTTESELDNLGFNIYRSTNANDQFSMINEQLIPGAGISSQRHEYEYIDKDVNNGVTYWYKLEDVDFSGNTKLHGLASAIPLASAAPREFRLYPNYPNPFNPVTTITYDLPQKGYVRISIYNIQGEEVTTLMKGNQEAGSYQLNWDGRDQNGEILSSGIYFLRIESSSYHKTNKMVFIR
jgi:hypothetical protein